MSGPIPRSTSTSSFGSRLPVPIFSLTLLASALLLFSVEPMFVKMIVPRFGGSPSVWNTCMVFFQAMLLAGYAYAHLTSLWLGARRQALLHLVVLCLPLLVLPIAVPVGWVPPPESNPILWLLGLLTVTVGLPFFALSTNAPLLQQWFGRTDHPSANDPYFLYSASNLGSLAALLGYLVLLEPRFRLAEQARIWAIGYGLLIVLVAACALLLWRCPANPRAMPAAPQPAHEASPPSPITPGRRCRWVLLSAVPSSLMLGVTTYLSTDLAAVPLMWVVPLSLYLLSFILVFARRPLVPHWLMVRLFPMAILPLAIVIVAGLTRPLPLLLLIHLGCFFPTAMVCHGELAADRPPASTLTEFYLWTSLGGVLGGLFNALLAPLIFTTVLEYPVALVLACLLWPGLEAREQLRLNWMDLALPLALGAWILSQSFASQTAGIESKDIRLSLIFGPAALVCASFRFRPVRFALGVAVFLLAGQFFTSRWGRLLLLERSFFGVYQVTLEHRRGPLHVLQHGTTLHGMQYVDPRKRRVPLSYYHPDGPLGQVFEAFAGDHPRLRHVGVVGLGTGTAACYATPAQRWTFYEIDPLVERIATDPALFTYLRDCLESVHVVLGDARLSLQRAPQASYELLILDAFSSDAIPIHLMTREALQLYVDKLADGGLLAFHVSNRHLMLQRVLGRLASAEHLIAVHRFDPVGSAASDAERASSHWVVLARRQEDLRALLADTRWHRLDPHPEAPLWTDDFSNILSVFKWR